MTNCHVISCTLFRLHITLYDRKTNTAVRIADDWDRSPDGMSEKKIQAKITRLINCIIIFNHGSHFKFDVSIGTFYFVGIAWTPSSQWILADADDDGHHKLFAIRINDSTVLELTENGTWYKARSLLLLKIVVS